jgi:uncharacterized protein (TIGR02145 family)
LSSFADNLRALCVAGWDASLNKWVALPSAADTTSPIFGTASVLATSGTVSTSSAIVPNSYAAYSLGKKLTCPEDIDIAGIAHKVVPLAGKCWTENLRTPTVDNIPNGGTYTCAGCAAQLDTVFGLLYSWDAAVGANPVQGICPAGWRLPTTTEWLTLNTYPVEDLQNPTYWLKPNAATNATGFDLRGAGYYNGTRQRFENIYGYTAFWSSDAATATTALAAIVRYNCNQVEVIETTVADGLSVRCVME